jgi:thiamine pyrophosphokinase
MNRVIIVSGGEAPSHELFEEIYEEGDQLIAADKGAEFFKKEHRIPHWLVGDFDSLDEETL